MSFLPDELVIDESVDTSRMRPEDDFAPVNDPRVPRKGVAQDSSRDLEADQFDQTGNLPNAFTQPKVDQYSRQPQPEPEYVDDIPDDDPIAGNQPAVEPGDDEGDVDQVEFPEELLNAAGLTLEQAQEFGSVEAVQSAVRLLDTKFVTDGKGAFSRAPQSTAEDIIPEEDNWELPAPEGSDDWDEDTKKLVSAMGDQFKSMLSKRDQQIKQQQEFIQKHIEEEKRERGLRELQEFDNLVNSLPDEWAPLLGRGTAFELDRNSMAFNNRVQLDQTMAALQEGNRLAGRPAIPKDELMIRSLSVAFPDVHRQLIRREVVQEVDQRQQLMTRRPTQRNRPALTPVQKAGQTAEEWYRKHNMSYDNMDDFEL